MLGLLVRLETQVRHHLSLSCIRADRHRVQDVAHQPEWHSTSSVPVSLRWGSMELQQLAHRCHQGRFPILKICSGKQFFSATDPQNPKNFPCLWSSLTTPTLYNEYWLLDHLKYPKLTINQHQIRSLLCFALGMGSVFVAFVFWGSPCIPELQVCVHITPTLTQPLCKHQNKLVQLWLSWCQERGFWSGPFWISGNLTVIRDIDPLTTSTALLRKLAYSERKYLVSSLSL